MGIAKGEFVISGAFSFQETNTSGHRQRLVCGIWSLFIQETDVSMGIAKANMRYVGHLFSTD